MSELKTLADAVMYEGYMLWPYTPSALKNQRRWTFGCVFPPSWTALHPDDAAAMRTQVLLESDPHDVDVTVRFLQEGVERSVGRRQDIEQTLSRLPQHYASALLLRHYQGLSLAETADALGITENAAKLRLFRARKAFAQIYGSTELLGAPGEWEAKR